MVGVLSRIKETVLLMVGVLETSRNNPNMVINVRKESVYGKAGDE